MNQSNKALREYEKLIEIFDSINLPAKQREQILKWHHKQIALVTNHIKGKMPKEIEEAGNYGDASYGEGYNQALDEVSQILKEMGNK